MDEICIRESVRNYSGAAFSNGYYEINPRELSKIDSKLREALIANRCAERVYDREATAYHNGEGVREEPVMLHRWKGNLNQEGFDPKASNRDYDTVGLKVIIRGRGDIQDRVYEILNWANPEIDEDCKTYVFGHPENGSDNWLDATI